MKTKQVRRTEAEKRQSASDAMSPVDRLAQLDKRLGKDTGATRERTRLMNLIAKKVVKA